MLFYLVYKEGVSLKHIKIIIIIVATLFIFTLVYLLYPWIILFLGVITSPNPPEPEITYGEFPISITYEINGEIKLIEDIIVCEFDGYKNMGTAGKRRVWKSRLKSGNERLILLRVEESDLTFEITSTWGLPEYYMGDFRQSVEEYERAMKDDRYLGYVQWEDGVQTGSSIPKEEAWEKYHIKIINQDYSSPIENTFK